MIKNKMPFLVGFIVFFLVFTIALALENVLESTNVVSEIDFDVMQISKNNVVFYNDGYINYLNYLQGINHSKKIQYFDLDGELKSEIDVPFFYYGSMFDDIKSEMIVSDKYVYIFDREDYKPHSFSPVTNEDLIIHKYDDSLNEISSIKLSDFGVKYESLYYVDDDNDNVYIYISNESSSKIYNIDSEFKEVIPIETSDENLKKYFPSLIITQNLQLDEDVNFSLLDKCLYLENINNYVIGSKKSIGTLEDEDTSISYLKYVENDEVLFEIENENYISFSYPRKYNNLIFVFGGYNDTMIGYKSDILVYDLSGNLLQIVENNSVNRSYDIMGDKLILSRNYFDGELERLLEYNIFSTHKVYFYNDIYKINDDFLGSSVTDNPKEEKPIYDIKNPETKDIAIILILLLSVVSFIYFIITNKKKIC